MLKSIATGLGLCLFLQAGIASSEVLWRAEGFAQPESSLFDEASNHLVVSNVGGSPADANGEGFLSLVSPDGKIENLHWVDGLDAPKGMAILGPHLIVSDITKIRVIHRATGELVNTIEVPEARFLNDVAADANGAYISDLVAGKIYHYADGKVTEWLDTSAVAHPNGLYIEGDKMIMGSWGEQLDDNWSTTKKGSVFTIDLNSRAITRLKGAEEVGNLDGVTRIGKILYFNDWVTGDIFSHVEGETYKKVITLAKGLADISANGDTLFLPLMKDDALEAHRFKSE